jgi:hypothetical protein
MYSPTKYCVFANDKYIIKTYINIRHVLTLRYLVQKCRQMAGSIITTDQSQTVFISVKNITRNCSNLKKDILTKNNKI